MGNRQDIITTINYVKTIFNLENNILLIDEKAYELEKVANKKKVDRANFNKEFIDYSKDEIEYLKRVRNIDDPNIFRNDIPQAISEMDSIIIYYRSVIDDLKNRVEEASGLSYLDFISSLTEKNIDYITDVSSSNIQGFNINEELDSAKQNRDYHDVDTTLNESDNEIVRIEKKYLQIINNLESEEYLETGERKR